MYFIEHLCDMAQRENHLNFIRMVQKDIFQIVDAVAPSDGAGAANVKVVRRVLQGLQQKNFLPAETITEIEACLKERDTVTELATPSPVEPNEDGDSNDSQPALKTNDASRLDKRQIEQRIEEDRERHKRLKESIWDVGSDDEEFNKLWDEASEIGEDDYMAAEEDAMERRQAIEA
jgi:CTD kinase subunit gamma